MSHPSTAYSRLQYIQIDNQSGDRVGGDGAGGNKAGGNRVGNGSTVWNVYTVSFNKYLSGFLFKEMSFCLFTIAMS
jgi:hypothetical protein